MATTNAISPVPSKGSSPSLNEKAEPMLDRVSSYNGDAVDGVAPTKDEGDLERGLTPSMISMIALGGAIGTGLIIGTGTALTQGGPVGLLIGYSVMGAVCFCVMCALGEMSAYMPHKRGFAGHATMFVDPAFGMAVGWNYLFKYLIVTPNQLSACAILISYWAPTLSPAVGISVFLFVIIMINLLGIKYFGHIEFWLSFAKIVVLTGLILLGIIIDLGGSPTGDRIGFRNWKGVDNAFAQYKGIPGAKGRFLGVWSVMTLSLFAYMGSELVGVCVGECKNPRKAIPAAIRKTFFRILFFYIIGSTVVGMVVPHDDPRLVSATKSKSTASASPFVVAIQIAQIKVLPSIVNACLLVFTLSASNSDLYIGSRTLYGLAADGKAPRIFLRCNSRGTPYVALALCACFCGIAYMSVSSGGAKVFGYLVSTVSVFGGLTWCGILYSHISFMRACKAQNIDRKTLPYMAPFQPYASWAALVMTLIVLFFKGFGTFIGIFDYKSFITHYIGVPTFLVIWAGYKIVWRSKVVKPEEVDLISGAAKFDELDDKVDEEAANAPKGNVWARTKRYVKEF